MNDAKLYLFYNLHFQTVIFQCIHFFSVFQCLCSLIDMMSYFVSVFTYTLPISLGFVMLGDENCVSIWSFYSSGGGGAVEGVADVSNWSYRDLLLLDYGRMELLHNFIVTSHPLFASLFMQKIIQFLKWTNSSPTDEQKAIGLDDKKFQIRLSYFKRSVLHKRNKTAPEISLSMLLNLM